MTTLIANGTVVGPTGLHPADVLIDGERIVALVEPFSTVLGADLAATADTVIDAAGKYVIPGGIDCHTHMELPFGGTFASDTFETGTRAAAFGGTTTIIDFAVQRTGERVQDGLAAWHDKADGQCAIDYGFHQIIGGVDDDSLKAMDELVAEGITSFKLFMAYPGVFYSDDGQILRAMQTAAANGSLVMMHAENGIAIDVLVAQALAAARPRRSTTARRARGRPRRKRRTGRSCWRGSPARRCTSCTCRRSRRSQPSRPRVTTDGTCSARPARSTSTCRSRNICLPRIRRREVRVLDAVASTRQGHQDDLWRYLRTNDLSVVSTDHCPFCMKEQKELGSTTSRRSPTGSAVSSTAWTSSTKVSSTARSSLAVGRAVRSTPARMFGLYPREAAIRRRGSHADVVVYDPNGTTTMSVDAHHMNIDYSAYEGTVVQGRVRHGVFRGHRRRARR